MTLDPQLQRFLQHGSRQYGSGQYGSGQYGSEPLDHPGLDLDAARRVTYVIEQSFRYEYEAPVRSLRQRLVIVPPARHGGQHRRAHQLEVTGAQARRQLRQDRHGNMVTWLRAEHVAQAVEFRLTAVVERIRRDGHAVLPLQALRSAALLSPTRLTAADDRLRDLAGRLPSAAVDPLDQAEWVCELVHGSLEYADGVTSVRTTAAEALADGRGVCPGT
jgi:transglutaminase-like putative cysteine protease